MFGIIEVSGSGQQKPVSDVRSRKGRALRQACAAGDDSGNTGLARQSHGRGNAGAAGKADGINAARIDRIVLPDVGPEQPDCGGRVLEIT